MNNFSSLIENSKQAVRYWWLLLIIGIALFAVGVLIFVYPAQSYLGMSLVFGWLMLISGILEVVLSSANKHFITGRGWMMAGGIIEIILGIILIFNVGLSAATLPIFLGFWLMMRGFSAIGLGGDMSALEIAGSGWTIFTGVLLLLCSLWILFQPLVIGTTAVIVCADTSEAWTRKYDGKNISDIDASIVTDHMMLAAASLNLDTLWICMFKPEAVREEFALPANVEPVNILLIGYGDGPAADPNRHDTLRKPLSATVFHERF